MIVILLVALLHFAFAFVCFIFYIWLPLVGEIKLILCHTYKYFCAILLPATAIAEGETIIQEALSQADNPHHSTVTCTAGMCFDAYIMLIFILHRHHCLILKLLRGF